MKVVDFDAEVITAESPEKLVEIVGRTCYKSEDKITESSYRTFLHNLITRQHFAMLEHGRLTFKLVMSTAYEVSQMKIKLDAEIMSDGIPKVYSYIDWSTNSMYINVSLSHLFNPRYEDTILQDYILACYEGDNSVYNYLTGTYISIERIDNLCDEKINDTFKDQSEHIAIKFVCDRGVSHELVRHRFAIAQESQRYCRYGSGKFGDNLSFICPTAIKEDSPEYFV